MPRFIFFIWIYASLCFVNALSKLSSAINSPLFLHSDSLNEQYFYNDEDDYSDDFLYDDRVYIDGDDNGGGDNGDDGVIDDLEDDFEEMFRNLEIKNAVNLTRECAVPIPHVESE